MKFQSTSLVSYMKSVHVHREMVRRLLQRDYGSRFKGSMFGALWSILTPVLTALVFTFVFTVVFPARWGAQVNAGTFDFTLLLLTGLAVHGMFAETITRAPGLIVSNANYVTRVVFPLEILPVVSVLNGLVTAAIALVIVVVANLLLNGQLHWTLIFLPAIVGPYLLFLLAACLVFAALGPYLRDLTHIVGFLVTLSLFLTPIFYPITAVPPRFQTAMHLNPLTFVVEQMRGIVLEGRIPDPWGWALYLAWALVALAAAYWLFQRLRTGFADVV